MPEEKFTIEAYEKRLREKLRKPMAMPDRQSLITGLLEKARARKSRKPTMELPKL